MQKLWEVKEKIVFSVKVSHRTFQLGWLLNVKGCLYLKQTI